jgi:hypothetical protein
MMRFIESTSAGDIAGVPGHLRDVAYVLLHLLYRACALFHGACLAQDAARYPFYVLGHLGDRSRDVLYSRFEGFGMAVDVLDKQGALETARYQGSEKIEKHPGLRSRLEDDESDLAFTEMERVHDQVVRPVLQDHIRREQAARGKPFSLRRHFPPGVEGQNQVRPFRHRFRVFVGRRLFKQGAIAFRDAQVGQASGQELHQLIRLEGAEKVVPEPPFASELRFGGDSLACQRARRGVSYQYPRLRAQEVKTFQSPPPQERAARPVVQDGYRVLPEDYIASGGDDLSEQHFELPNESRGVRFPQFSLEITEDAFHFILHARESVRSRYGDDLSCR